MIEPLYAVAGLAVGVLVGMTGSVPGIVAGSLVSTHASDRVLQPILADTLAVVGGKLVF